MHRNRLVVQRNLCERTPTRLKASAAKRLEVTGAQPLELRQNGYERGLPLHLSESGMEEGVSWCGRKHKKATSRPSRLDPELTSRFETSRPLLVKESIVKKEEAELYVFLCRAAFDFPTATQYAQVWQHYSGMPGIQEDSKKVRVPSQCTHEYCQTRCLLAVFDRSGRARDTTLESGRSSMIGLGRQRRRSRRASALRPALGKTYTTSGLFSAAIYGLARNLDNRRVLSVRYYNLRLIVRDIVKVLRLTSSILSLFKQRRSSVRVCGEDSCGEEDMLKVELFNVSNIVPSQKFISVTNRTRYARARRRGQDLNNSARRRVPETKAGGSAESPDKSPITDGPSAIFHWPRPFAPTLNVNKLAVRHTGRARAPDGAARARRRPRALVLGRFRAHEVFDLKLQ
ncbi:hypothetical protein EVAR_82593_1 [Eumeta japonica]|uniref:Uncharacterized protein n=1 Tax=Eumeta variegata TaxID=151549 RepID=A0A4C1X2K7_EUMVA|nr:hypothetical protein EVAR_82593_1 [Eumeta japonica]